MGKPIVIVNRMAESVLTQTPECEKSSTVALKSLRISSPNVARSKLTRQIC